MACRNLIQLITKPVAAPAVPQRVSLTNWEGVIASQPVGMNGPSGQRSESGACGPETLLGSQSTDPVNSGAYVLTRGLQEAKIAVTRRKCQSKKTTTTKNPKQTWRQHMRSSWPLHWLTSAACCCGTLLLCHSETAFSSLCCISLVPTFVAFFNSVLCLFIQTLSADLFSVMLLVWQLSSSKGFVNEGSAWVKLHIMAKPSTSSSLTAWSHFTLLFPHISAPNVFSVLCIWESVQVIPLILFSPKRKQTLFV